ncbi:hypothetical protein [Lacticaseibacillus zhaodongensis]|uniref:hypothetical protein n=1 Tax=Lacticaseibacillus zhaodongensis TaxID=2668065 RepID=UPI0012D33597|nr:hypothetical protein [Lacticaseibacillus zhaodongensis]
MKKTVIALLLAGLLAGCGSQTGSKSTSSSSTESTQTTKSKAQTKSKTDAVASSSSSDSTSSSSSSSDSSTNSGDHYQQLTKQIQSKVGNQWLPDTVKSNGVVNASASTNASGTSVKFYSGNSAVDLNDATLSNKGADYSLDKKTFASSGAAADSINWIGAQDGGQTVDLGDNITGTVQGAAGSTYIHWNEGNWSITVRASNVNGQDPTALAKQLVALFHTASLPAPSNKGAANFNLNDGAGAQTISWNDGSSVYTFSGSNAMATAETATK